MGINLNSRVLLSVALLSAAVLMLTLLFRLPIQIAYEKTMLAISPSGEKAYEYGVRHFNAQRSSEYEISAAEYFFDRALTLDPSLLYVHHELARIYFLRGDFFDALMQINTQIAQHGDSTPNSYYMRGLIEGYVGDYEDSAKDYTYFLKFDPYDWAGMNDEAWVLLKAKHFQEAAELTAKGLKYFPQNPWLLNNNAIALYELGEIKEAEAPAEAAAVAAAKLTDADWLHAYPGNDPQVASEGVAQFKAAAAKNIHMIEVALASSTL